MDFSKFKTSDWLKIGGALGFLIFGFFDWISVDTPGGTGGLGGSNTGGNVFDFTWTGVIPWLLILATGVITFLLATGTMKPGKLPWPLIMLGATALAALLLLIRLIFNPLDGKDQLEAIGFDVGRAFGMIASVIAGLVALAGAVMGFTESGGSFSDLKDMDKLKSQFNTGGAAVAGGAPPPPPPPPPAGGPPPPPPPPL